MIGFTALAVLRAGLVVLATGRAVLAGAGLAVLARTAAFFFAGAFATALRVAVFLAAFFLEDFMGSWFGADAAKCVPHRGEASRANASKGRRTYVSAPAAWVF